MQRGEIWWASLPEPVGSGPGYSRPVLLIQANSFTRSRIRTVLVAVMTKNTALAQAPGNVFVPAQISGLPLDSVVNVSQIITIDKGLLTEYVGSLPAPLMAQVDAGLRLVMNL
jgi:mRNA interferase MazF